jgi:hypothetical protein
MLREILAALYPARIYDAARFGSDGTGVSDYAVRSSPAPRRLVVGAGGWGGGEGALAGAADLAPVLPAEADAR